MRRDLAPPSGQAAPLRAQGPGGPVELLPLATEVAMRHRAEFPDEAERYGDAGLAWCVHDNQHLLNWAFSDAHGGMVDLLEQVAWLARVLGARGYPLDRLARDLEIGAEVVGDPAVAERLRAAAESVPATSG